MPFEFLEGQNRQVLGLNGREKISIKGINNLKPNSIIECEIFSQNSRLIKLKSRIDTRKELDYFRGGGILNYVLNSIVDKAS